LEQIQQEVEAVHTVKSRRKGNQFTGRVLAFIDDVTILVHGALVDEVVEVAADILDRAGLPLNEDKTVVVLGRSGEQHYRGEKKTVGAEVILGAVIGHDAVLRGKLFQDITKKIIRELENIDRYNLPGYIRFNLIRFYVNPKFTYLDRVSVPTALYIQAATKIDEKVDHAILRIADGEHLSASHLQTKSFGIIRELPQRLGGLGIGRHGGVAGQKGRVLSRYLLRQHVYRYYLNGWGIAETMDRYKFTKFDVLLDDYRKRGGEGGSWWNEEDNWVLPEDITTASANVVAEVEAQDKDYRELVKQATEEIYKQGVEAVFQNMQGRQQRSWRAWFRSSIYNGSGRFLVGSSDHLQGDFELTNDPDYRIALRMRLLLDPVPVPPNGTICPLCTRHTHDDDYPLHLMDCSDGGWFWTKRHDLGVNTLLAEFLRTAGYETEIGQKVGVKEDGQGIVSDIVFHKGIGERHLVDVTVANPAAPSYEAEQPDQQEDAVAAFRERQKREKYASVANSYRIVPFAVEATGRLGPTAKDLIHEIEPDDKKKARCTILRDRIAMKVTQLVVRQIRVLSNKIVSNFSTAYLTNYQNGKTTANVEH
jgi:hypothetical protein